MQQSLLKDRALEALDGALRPGVTSANVLVVESKDRSLSTKHGRARGTSSSDDLGLAMPEACYSSARGRK